jgi:DNA topoisomerase I
MLDLNPTPHAPHTQHAPHAREATRTPAPPPPCARPPSDLVWSHDTQPGIARVRLGLGLAKGFAYTGPDGKGLQQAEVLERIRRLAVPPAWEQVWICADPAGHLQATGRDARGRKQYRYHADWSAARGDTKFSAIQRFGHALPRVRREVERALAARDTPPRTRLLATLVHLLDATYVRIGNTEYTRSNGSYGLTTLRNRHADVRGDVLRLSFVGKSRVRHDVCIADARVARIVRRCRELPGHELFQYRGPDGEIHRVDSADVNAWLAQAAGERITAKDFRTWHASVLALGVILRVGGEDCNGEPASRRASRILGEVAKQLGNTVAVCRKAYVHPRVLGLLPLLQDAASRSTLVQQHWAAQPKPRRGLERAERQLLSLLDGRAPRRARAARH